MFVNQDLRKDIKAALAGFGLAVVVGTTGTPGVVLAQEVIEEVIVTARKREETMQDVPLAVSAVGRVELESAFLSNSTAITQFAPNLIFDDISAGTPGGGGISIRGISFQDVEKTFDPTVLIHVDGVPLGTNTANVMKLLDVERVEILRGPQGTLFGKNAVGGVINIFRLKPKLNEWAGKARARVDDNNSVDFEGVLNIPLGESLAAKVNVARLDQGGYYDNVTTGDEEGDSVEDRYGVHLLWQPNDDLTAEVQYNRSDMDGTIAPMLSINSPQATFCLFFGICATSDDAPISGDRVKGAGGLRQDFELDSSDYQTNISWQLTSQLTGVLIYGHREIDETGIYDFDGSPLEIFHVRRPNEYKQDSVEARIDYDNGANLTVTGGYFYWHSELESWRNEIDISTLLGLPVDACGFAPGQTHCQLQEASADSESNSVFAEGEYRLNDQWSVTAGARWIEETKKMNLQVTLPVLGLVALPPTSGDRTDDDVIYRVGLSWKPADETLFYLTRSTGFRSGGFSIRATTPEVASTGFEPETVENTELGAKTTLLDGRIRLNAAVFNMDYEDMQQEINIPGGAAGNQDAVVNAAAATLRGVELELAAILADPWRVDFNVGYLDAKYDDFRAKVFADGTANDDLSGLPLRRAPEWTYTAALNYAQQVGPGELTGRLSNDWRDDYAGTLTDFPRTHVDSYGVLDLSLSYRLDQWQVSAFGRNLTDEDEYSHTFVVSPDSIGGSLFTFATPRQPRTYGAELTYSFGGY
jgi:iron complex outermembrane receptor protein